MAFVYQPPFPNTRISLCGTFVHEFCCDKLLFFLPSNITILFLAGIHTYCTPDCASYDKDAPENEEPRPTREEPEDILDIPELEEGVTQSEEGAVAAGEDGDRRQEDTSGADNAPPSTRPDGSPDGADTEAGAVTHSSSKGGATSAQKKTIKPCVGSKFTVASLLQSLDDSIRLANTKEHLWARTSVALAKTRRTRVDLLGEESSEQMESLDALEAAVNNAKAKAEKVSEAALAFQQSLEMNVADAHGVSGCCYLDVAFTVQDLFRYRQRKLKIRNVKPFFTFCPFRPLPSVYGASQRMPSNDRKKCDISLDRVKGPWQKPSVDGSFTSACDGPANLVVIEEVQVCEYML